MATATRTTRDGSYAWSPGGSASTAAHVFRKTCATILDDAGLSARMIADQLGHSRPSMTQDVYMGRKTPNALVVQALDLASPDPERAASDA